jgi:hypothetical protein
LSSDEEERLLEAGLHVLDEPQDAMCEGIRDPWPNEGIARFASRRGPRQELRLWFEDARGVALTLPAIPFD